MLCVKYGKIAKYITIFVTFAYNKLKTLEFLIGILSYKVWGQIK